MFRTDTVFVLGAGASWHYGYPTGESLVDAIIAQSRRFASYCQNRLAASDVTVSVPNYVSQFKGKDDHSDAAYKNAWEHVLTDARDLIKALETVRPLVIDYFLAWRKSLQSIGTFMIASVILECEAIWQKENSNQNRRKDFLNRPLKPTPEEIARFNINAYRDNWYRFIVHKLAYGCAASEDLSKNKVSFVTFNYDVSLELNLRAALSEIGLFSADDIQSFLGADRIIHMYGAVRTNSFERGHGVNLQDLKSLGIKSAHSNMFIANPDYTKQKAAVDKIFAAFETIRTIEQVNKDDSQNIAKVKASVFASHTMYLLGYGFDANNNMRLGLGGDNLWLRVGATPNLKNIMYTNFNNIDTISKRIKGVASFASPHPSTKNVYDAIEQDFEALGNE